MKHPCAYTGEMGEDFIDCACGDNEEYGFMLACEACGAWEHGECCGVKSEEAIPEGYECSTCVKEKNVESFPRQLLVDLDDDDDNVKEKEDDPGEEEENEALVEDMIKKVKSSKTTIGDYNHTSQKRSALTLRQNLRSIQTHKVATRSAPRGDACAACADANTRMKSNRW